MYLLRPADAVESAHITNKYFFKTGDRVGVEYQDSRGNSQIVNGQFRVCPHWKCVEFEGV